MKKRTSARNKSPIPEKFLSPVSSAITPPTESPKSFIFNNSKSTSKKSTSVRFNSTVITPQKTLTTTSDLKDLVSSSFDSLKRNSDRSHSEIMKELEASQSRLHKRFKTQACQQLMEETDKECRKICEQINENQEAMKASYVEFIAEAQASASRDLMYTVYGDSSATGVYYPVIDRQSDNIDGNSGIDISPAGTQNLYQDVDSPPQAVNKSPDTSRLSGGKRKYSYEESWTASIDSLKTTLASSFDQLRDYTLNVVDREEQHIAEAMDILYRLPNISNGSALFFLGCNLIEIKSKRCIFCNLKNDEECENWLKIHRK